MPLSDAALQTYTNQYAPEFHFHPDEQYFPCDVDYYFQHCNLYNRNHEKISTAAIGVTSAELQAANADSDSYLQIAPGNEAVKSGALSRLAQDHTFTVYSHVVKQPP